MIVPPRSHLECGCTFFSHMYVCYTSHEIMRYTVKKSLLFFPSPPGMSLTKHSLAGNLTINVPLFKKLRDIIFFWWENHFMSHFEGHFEGAKTFLTP
jgi:hypothetical protein